MKGSQAGEGHLLLHWSRPEDRALTVFVFQSFSMFHLVCFNNDFVCEASSVPGRDTFFGEEQMFASQGWTFITEVKVVWQVIRFRQKLSEPLHEEAFLFCNW